MKKYILTLFILLSTNVSFAQENFRINDSGLLYPDTKWSVSKTNTLNPSSFPDITYYEVNGDTIINSFSYYKLYKSDYGLFAFLREESKKLYVYFLELEPFFLDLETYYPELKIQKEKLIYDFSNWEIGSIHKMIIRKVSYCKF